MKEDQLKSAWQHIPGENQDVALQELLNKRQHPALKRMRRQMLFEGVAYLFFLVVYFDLFDGHEKPVYANILLVAAVAIAFANNIAGYALANAPLAGNNIRELLDARITRLKTFAKLAVGSRALLGICLLVFFGSVMAVDQTRIWIMVGIILAFVFQLYILWKIWSARINGLKKARDHFSIAS